MYGVVTEQGYPQAFNDVRPLKEEEQPKDGKQVRESEDRRNKHTSK